MDDLLGSFRWYDALCINQKDNEEKSKQVQLMGAIYFKVLRVIIWLSKEVFHLKNLDLYLGKFLELDKAWTNLAGVAEGRIDEGLAAAAKSISQRSWDLAQIVFGQPYFTRVWMIQEVVMAKQCYVLLEDGLIEWATMDGIGAILSGVGENVWIIPLPVKMRKPLRCLQKMSTLRQRLVDIPKLGPLRKILASSLSDPNLDPGYKLTSPCRSSTGRNDDGVCWTWLTRHGSLTLPIPETKSTPCSAFSLSINIA